MLKMNSATRLANTISKKLFMISLLRSSGFPLQAIHGHDPSNHITWFATCWRMEHTDQDDVI